MNPLTIVTMANRMPDANHHLAPSIGILLLLFAARATADSTPQVERWGLWETTLGGPTNGNPYVEVQLTATFERGDRRIIVPGFWDGGDKYRIRFSPPEEGDWRYVTGSNRPEMDGRRGKLTAVAPAGTNHGPVQIFKTSYLRYADGSPYHQLGTTCYAWTHQPDALQEQTLRTLADAPFNKIRFCVFPKSYAYNTNEPALFPFARRPDRTFDFDRPDPAFWRHFEGRILDLQRLGIEADIILWHPYDRWGFSEMSKEQDDRYLRYGIARLSAFRNVWWSLANEYDLMAPGAMKGHRGNKTMDDWDRFFQILANEDPFQRLRSIHNCRGFYDHTRPWVTHASLQTSDMNAGIRFRAQFGKPVIYDECKYEGDVPQGWGNLTPREMSQRFWLGTLGGCYVGHGETYLHPEDILWWSKGGALHGKSAGRIQWLKDFMAQAPPFHDLQPAGDDKGRFLLTKPAEYYLLYAWSTEPQALDLAGERPYKIDRIDPWAMTISPLGTARPGARDFAPPQANMVYRFVPYAADEPLRPEAAIDAVPAAGRAPLSVRFSAPAGLEARWDFGDGSVGDEPAPSHVFAKPGLYVVTLSVTDAHGGRATAVREVAVDRDPSEPLLRLGFPGGETHALRLSGTAKRTDAGGFRFYDGAPWGWAETGVVDDLRGLRSFTIVGWLKPDGLAIGAGGNRILFCLNHDRDGIDLVCHADGRLRLAVNQWPDRVSNDSSPGKLVPGRWTLFSVAYDGTRERDNVRWSFSAPLDAPDPAAVPVPDRTTSHAAGPVGRDIGPLAVGNFNATLRGAGLDRQFRGEIRGLTLFGSRADAGGAEVPIDRRKAPRAVSPAGGALAGERLRVIVSTDIGGSDPDDFQSMVHYLVYADLFDTEGLVSSPPGAGRKAHILEALDAYAMDYARLSKRSDRYPTPDALRATASQGALDPAPAAGFSGPTEGSRRIIERARAADPRPLWILVWGSITDVAQALHDAPEITPKLHVYSIGSWNTRMDPHARDYVVKRHPDLWLIEADTTFRGMYVGGAQAGDLGNASFVERHVRRRGSLGDLFFAKKKDIKMGDTPSVLYLLRGCAEDPAGDHWGGAFVRRGTGPNHWTDNPEPSLQEKNFPGARSVSRWREAYLRDWRCRMDGLGRDSHPERAIP